MGMFRVPLKRKSITLNRKVVVCLSFLSVLLLIFYAVRSMQQCTAIHQLRALGCKVIVGCLDPNSVDSISVDNCGSIRRGIANILGPERVCDVVKLELRLTAEVSPSAFSNYLAKLPELHWVSVCENGIDDEQFNALCESREIKSLSIDTCCFSKDSFSQISRLKDLEFLRLSHLELSDSHGEAIASLPSLRVLTVHSSEFSSSFFAEMHKTKSLEDLAFLSTLSLRKETLRTIARIPCIRHLSMYDCDLDRDCIAELSRFRNLKTVSLNAKELESLELGDLLPVQSLEHVDLMQYELNERDIDVIRKFPNLKKLTLLFPTVPKGASFDQLMQQYKATGLQVEVILN